MNILNPTSLKEEIQLEAIVIYNSDSFDYFLSEMKRLIPLGSRVRFNLKVFSSIGGNNQNFYPKPVNVGGKKEANTFVDMTYNSEDDLRQVLFELSYLLEYNKTVLIDMYSKKDDCIKSNLELKKLFHRYWENNEPWGKNILSWKILSSPSQIPEATKPLPELPMPKLVPIPVLDDNITELEMVVAKAEVDSTYRENLIKCLLSQKK
jgi:hypothetical protein